jgi:hypothetical protein
MNRPTRPYRALRAGVGTVAVVLVLALWAHSQLTGDPLSTLWEVVVLAIVIAGGYAVFGQRTMSAAMDDAQDLTNGSSEESESDQRESG